MSHNSMNSSNQAFINPHDSNHSSLYPNMTPTDKNQFPYITGFNAKQLDPSYHKNIISNIILNKDSNSANFQQQQIKLTQDAQKLPKISYPQRIIKPITVVSDNGLRNHKKQSNSSNREVVCEKLSPPKLKTPSIQAQSVINKDIQNKSNNQDINNVNMVTSPLYNSALQFFLNQDAPTNNLFKNPTFLANRNQSLDAEILKTINTRNSQIKNGSSIVLQEKYRLYLRYYRENVLIKRQLAQVEKQKEYMREEIQNLQNYFEDDYPDQSKKNTSNSQFKKKRHRRNANQIVRSHVCPIKDCDRMYGTQPSLIQHVKLKHNKQFKKSGLSLANMIAQYGSKIQTQE